MNTRVMNSIYRIFSFDLVYYVRIKRIINLIIVNLVLFRMNINDIKYICG